MASSVHFSNLYEYVASEVKGPPLLGAKSFQSQSRRALNYLHFSSDDLTCGI
jgi:hypothetical protein